MTLNREEAEIERINSAGDVIAARESEPAGPASIRPGLSGSSSKRKILTK